ncbi:MAG TPA: hypothetical protein VH142_04065 [Polyangiaceae bacterium]|jgi:xanthine/uracil permease|nr:hypothetical protein [Polyangiaceae bacterium]
MTRHKNAILVLMVIVVAFAVALMLNHYIVAVGVLLAGAFGFATYMAGEADFRDSPYDHRPRRPSPREGSHTP